MNGKKTPGGAGTHTFGSFRVLEHGELPWQVSDEIGNLFIGLFPGVLLHLLHIV